MITIIFTFSASLFLITLYLIIQFLLLVRLRYKLQHADLAGFKKELGTNYRVRDCSNEFARHKWIKGWLNIKADFDKDGCRHGELVVVIFWGEFYRGLAF